MPEAYRIVKARYAGDAFDGEGARYRVDDGRASAPGLSTLRAVSRSPFLRYWCMCSKLNSCPATWFLKLSSPTIRFKVSILPCCRRIGGFPPHRLEPRRSAITGSGNLPQWFYACRASSSHQSTIFLSIRAIRTFPAYPRHPTPLDVDPRVFRKATGASRRYRFAHPGGHYAPMWVTPHPHTSHRKRICDSRRGLTHLRS